MNTMNGKDLNVKTLLTIVLAVAVIILAIVFGSQMTTTIEAGHAGVLFKTFGGGLDKERTFGEGFHLIAPWNKMYIYETRQQEIAETMNVLSSNGLEINVDVSAWYQPEYGTLGYLHSQIGTDYLARVIIPALRASARSVIGRYTPDQLYSTKRDAIQDEIFLETKNLLDKKYITLN